MIKKVILSSFILIILYGVSFSQQKNVIKWKTIEEVFELAKKEARPIILDVYTDWCGWCKHMNKTTFANANIINYINNNFYAAKFDAETLDSIMFKGKIYKNKKNGRKSTHDLAIKILDGKMSYPTIVYFDKKGAKMVVPGYKKPNDIIPFLVFFAENIGETVSMNDFMINYMYAFPESFKKDPVFNIEESLKPDTLGKIEWIEPDSVMKESNKVKKPIMVYLYSNWCVGCKVMNKTSFGNTKLAKQVNEKYYAIKVNSLQRKGFSFLGSTFKGAERNQPHEIIKKFLKYYNYNKPTILFFDENHKFISRVDGYLLKEQLLPLTSYFHEKEYKKKKFQDYLKEYKKNNN